MKEGSQTLHRTEKLVINRDIPHDLFGDVIELEEEEDSTGAFFPKENMLWSRAHGPCTHL